jgi:hypothetical protein
MENLEERRLLAVVTVDTEFDTFDVNDGLISLREAIFATNIVPGPETIEFAPLLVGKTIRLTEGELRITDHLTIVGPGADLLTIDAGGSDPTPGEVNFDGNRVFRVDDGANNGPDKHVSIVGLTLTGGNVDEFARGGAIYSVEDLTVEQTIVTGNAAYEGGGIFAQRLVVHNSSIVDNWARRRGGGISATNLQMAQSGVNGNSAEDSGGGIWIGGDGVAQSEIVLSSIRNNSTNNSSATVANGGGIALVDGGLSIFTSEVRENSTAGRGAGIAAWNSQLLLIDSTVAANSAYHGGGLWSDGATDLSNSTVSGNSAFVGGGAFIASTTNAVFAIRQGTVTANTATLAGGLFVESGDLIVDGSIVAQNQAGYGPDVTGLAGTSLDVRFSLIGSNQGTALVESPIGTPDGNGNLIGGAGLGLIDPLLGPLAENGGPTRTHALLPGSAAIDAGDPAAIANMNGVGEFDQRGIPHSRVAIGRIDIGAYEVPAVEIRGFKWKDLNRDGSWDHPTEPGLPGWTIYLDDNRNGALDDGEIHTTTAEDGSYAFTDLPAGEYTVAEVMQENWEQTFPGGSVSTELIVNGNFEAGELSGWTVVNEGSGSFLLNDGSFDPPGPELPSPPFAGDFSAIASPSSTSTQTIYQDVVLPNSDAIELQWADLIHNHATSFNDPSQEYRVEIRNLSNELLQTVYSTGPGDALSQDWTERVADISQFAGQEIRVAFVVEVRLGYFNVQLDDVQIVREAGVSTHTIALSAGEFADDLNFGNAPPAEIHGYKWSDLNGDGVWNQEDEPALAGWTVFLDANLNGQLDEGESSTVTAEDGSYSFTSLAPDQYVVAEVPQVGWVQTSPNTAAVSGLIKNGDFEIEALTGWTIENTGSGTFSLNDGSFIPSGPDVAMPPFAGDFSVLSNQTGPGVHAIHQDITIPVRNDLRLQWTDQIRNHATLFADPEQEFRVEIRDTANQVLAVLYSTTPGDQLIQPWTTRTADLSQFAGQTVRIAFVEQDNRGYFNVHLDDVQITSLSSPSTVTVILAAGQIAHDVNFGNAPPGEIHGSKWHDLNGDGIWDVENEPALEGWTIFLDENGNGVLDEGETSTVTDANGSFSFVGLPFGQYVVAEVSEPNWLQTFPVGEVVTDFIENGNFESGNFDGWNLQSTGNGAITINDGNFDPSGPDGPLPPFADSFSALSNQDGPGRFTISQNVDLPQNGQLTLEWADRIRSHAPTFQDPVQEFRVEIRDLADQVLDTVFSTNPGDPVLQGWTDRSADLSMFAGQAVRIAFVVEVTLGYFNVHLDDIRLATSEPAGSNSVNIPPNQVVTGVNFGNQFIVPGEIHGAKWHDLDGDKMWDRSEEPALEGWTIYIDVNRNGDFDEDEPSTITGPDGEFAFYDLPPGDYVIAEVMRPGWVQTSPGGHNAPDPIELIVNGGFETGDFTAWTVNTPVNPFAPWAVSRTGTTGRRAPISPVEGDFDAWNGFDGGGPIEFTMFQDVSIPTVASATLTWSDRAIWSVNGEPRTVAVEIRDPVSDAILDTVYSFATDAPTGDTGWVSHTVDLTAYSGSDVRIYFVEHIPQSFTGPGQIEFDAISLIATPLRNAHLVSLRTGEIISNLNFGNIAAPPLPGDYNGDNHIDAADYTIWRDALGQTGVTPFSGADGDGDSTIDADDYAVWKSHFGQSLTESASAAGFEPAIASVVLQKQEDLAPISTVTIDRAIDVLSTTQTTDMKRPVRRVDPSSPRHVDAGLLAYFATRREQKLQDVSLSFADRSDDEIERPVSRAERFPGLTANRLRR